MSFKAFLIFFFPLIFIFFFNELCRDHRHQWMKTGKFKTHLISVGICITQFLFYKDLFFCSLSKVYYFLLKSSREFHMVNFTIAIQLIWFAFLMPDSDIFGHALFRNARRQTSSFFISRISCGISWSEKKNVVKVKRKVIALSVGI